MGIGSKRASSVVAALCLFSAVSVVGARAKADANTAPSIVKVDAGKTTLFAYAPIANDAPKPLTIYLHGVCGQPANGCPYFRQGATSASWLLCPSAPTPCEGGGGSWAGTVAMQERAEKASGGKIKFAFKWQPSNAGVFVTKPGPFTEMVSKAVTEATGRTPKLSTTGGTSDARFITHYCPVVEFGLVGQTMHQVDECVPIADLRALTVIYRKIIDRYFD